MTFLKKNFFRLISLAVFLFLTVPAARAYDWPDINVGPSATYELVNETNYSNQSVTPNGTYDADKAAEAQLSYNRAGTCVQVIVQVLHGESPSGEGIRGFPSCFSEKDTSMTVCSIPRSFSSLIRLFSKDAAIFFLLSVSSFAAERY